MSLYGKINRLLHSKEVKEMAPYVPYGPLALNTLDRLSTLVHDAKEGDPVAVETVRAIKVRSDAGDVNAMQTVATLQVASKAHDIKQAKNKSLYAKGNASVYVGHDPIEFGATRDQRGGAGGGGGVTVTDVQRGILKSAVKRDTRGSKNAVITDQRGKKAVTYYDPTNPAGPGYNWSKGTGPSAVVINPMGNPLKVLDGPAMPSLPPDPYGQQDPYGQGYPQDPYGQMQQDPFYGQYGGGYDPYGTYGGYGGYGGYSYPGYDPYGLQGLPPGYGYEEPVIDRGGFQQYDPNTDSFYSSNQKQVYDEATGMFYPANAENPYASLYGF